jgi:Iap family predicted aminopeptidase
MSPECEAKLDAHVLRSIEESVEYKTHLAGEESDTAAPKDRKLYYVLVMLSSSDEFGNFWIRLCTLYS